MIANWILNIISQKESGCNVKGMDHEYFLVSDIGRTRLKLLSFWLSNKKEFIKWSS